MVLHLYFTVLYTMVLHLYFTVLYQSPSSQSVIIVLIKELNTGHYCFTQSALQCTAVQCRAQCIAIQCRAQCSAIQCTAVQCRAQCSEI